MQTQTSIINNKPTGMSVQAEDHVQGCLSGHMWIKTNTNGKSVVGYYYMAWAIMWCVLAHMVLD